MENYIVAIDLGTSQSRIVAALCDEKKPYGLNIVYTESQHSQGIKRGAVYSKEDVLKVVRNLVAGVEKKLTAPAKRKMVGDAKRYVCVNIGGLNFIDTVMVEKLPLNGQTVTLRTLQAIEKKAEDSQLQYSEDDKVTRLVSLGYAIDNEPFSDDVLNRSGDTFEAKFLCFKAKQKVLSLISSSFPENCKPNKYYTSTSAKAAVVLPSTLKRDGVVLIDLGSGSTGIAAFYKEALRYEVEIPIGSDTITNDIASALGISTRDAESVKHRMGFIKEAEADNEFKFGLDGGRSTTFDGLFYNFVVKARVEEIATYVATSIMEAQKRSGCRDFQLVLTGGGSLLKGIEPIIADKTGMKVVSVDPVDLGSDINPVDFAAAVGMASMEARLLLSKVFEPTLPIEPNPMPEPASVQTSNQPTEPATEEKEPQATPKQTESHKVKKGRFSGLFDKLNDIFDDDK